MSGSRAPRFGPGVGAPARRRGRDVYVYFDNDQQAHAPRNAAALNKLLAA
jgi:uncharacterized protein YecE (DUF72 family)